MDVTSPTLGAASSPSASGATPFPNAGQATAVLSSDFEVFLQMLTAQARYQDPLEPMDNSEYAAQLAQFSMVEQQVLSNDLLTALTAQLGAGNMAQLSGWIGMEARSTAAVNFDGQPITVYPAPAAASDDVKLVVYDASGTEVQSASIPNSREPLQWAGTHQDGTPFENGNYTFAVESRANGELILSEPAETYALITEARSQSGGTVLILEGGSSIDAESVSGLRNQTLTDF